MSNVDRSKSIGVAVIPTATGVQRINGPAANFSRRQVQVLVGVARGLSYKALPAELSLSTHTIVYHLSELRSRFGVPTNTALVAAAIVVGVLTNDQWPIQASDLLVIDVGDTIDPNLL